MEESELYTKLPELLDLAFQYGPFFFALFFLLVISRKSHNRYSKLCERKEPLPTEAEIKVAKHNYYLMTYFSLGLVVVSLVWWIFHYDSHHVFSGKIEGLKEYQKVDSSSFFLKVDYHKPIVETAPSSHTDHFLIVKKEPFKVGETFDLTLYKISNNAIESTKHVEIVYDGNNDIKLRYDVDESTGESGLIIVKNTSNIKLDFNLIKQAHAGFKGFLKELKQPTQKANDYYEIKQNVSPIFIKKDIKISNKEAEIVKVLQDERSSISSKISSINILIKNNSRDKLFNKYIRPEPLVLTIFDLGRHTDIELAAKARFLSKKINIKNFLLNATSKNSMTKKEASNFVLRLDEKTGMELLNELEKHTPSPWSENLLTKINSKQVKFSALIATAASQGDRYYVKASWDKGNEKTIDCLTKLFNEELISNRDIEEEHKIMNQRSERYSYWYSKQWALDMNVKIIGCGGRSSFMGF